MFFPVFFFQRGRDREGKLWRCFLRVEAFRQNSRETFEAKRRREGWSHGGEEGMNRWGWKASKAADCWSEVLMDHSLGSPTVSGIEESKEKQAVCAWLKELKAGLK